MGYYKRDGALIKALVDKMLLHVGSDYNAVMANPMIENIPWFDYYTWTQESSDVYKDWFINLLRFEVRPKFSKRMAEKEYNGFNLFCGLKVLKNEDINC